MEKKLTELLISGVTQIDLNKIFPEIEYVEAIA